MKFAIIADIHLGTARKFKGIHRVLYQYSESLLYKFVNDINTRFKPSFVIQLGDLITDNDYETDKKCYLLGLNILDKLKCPHYNILGNHDIVNIPMSELLKFIGYKTPYYSFDMNGYHYIVLFTDYDTKSRFKSVDIDKEQLTWLKNDLSVTSKKTVVFTHYSLAEQDLKDNFWFSTGPEYCLVKNRKKVRTILKNSGKVIAVFNGHLHWSKLDVHDDIPYFNIESLVENFNNNNIVSNSYTIVKLTTSTIKVTVYGNNPTVLKYPIKK